MGIPGYNAKHTCILPTVWMEACPGGANRGLGKNNRTQSRLDVMKEERSVGNLLDVFSLLDEDMIAKHSLFHS